MKTKILKSVISFILFMIIYSTNVLGVTNDVTTNTEINFKLLKIYHGEICIDNPTNGRNFIKPDDTKIEINGWAVSNDEEASLRLLLDGNIVLENLQRTEDRKDIDFVISPKYGGVEKTPNAGFKAIADISNLSAGSHSVKVEQISGYGDVITSHEIFINIENKKYQGDMYIDNPEYGRSFIRPDDTMIDINGWAVSNDEWASLRLLLDGNIVLENLQRTEDRKDIDFVISPKYGGVEKTPNAAFKTIADISNLGAGSHSVKVEQISRYGEVITSHEILINIENKKYQGEMYIDNPEYGRSFIRPDDAMIDINGWAVSNDEWASLRLVLDGNIVLENLQRTEDRKDIDFVISPKYGGVEKTPNAAFKTTADISGLGAGSHSVKVEQISRYGEVITSHEIWINIENKKYLAEMCLDTPTYNQEFNLGENIAISGWAVSDDENAFVEIYVDGNWKATTSRYYREDVKYYMDKYSSKTLNAGFGRLINSSEIGAGVHKVTAYEKSRYGDIIAGVETQIKILTPDSSYEENNDDYVEPDNNYDDNVNPTSGTKGIDVSVYQGNIDWGKVASSGVKYSMIRAGYRGYGNGKFAEDTKFKTNFINSVNSGIKTGVYFYSTAINTDEAKKDAEYVISLLRKYGYQNKVTMPIAIDLELISGVNTRDKNVSRDMRTKIANTFCQTIASYGYTPMIYACKAFLNNNMYANSLNYDVWVAQYNSKCTYSGKYTMWQYSSTGKIPGINGNVDCNICYKNY